METEARRLTHGNRWGPCSCFWSPGAGHASTSS